MFAFIGRRRKRPLAGKDFVKHKAKRINVAPRADFFSFKLLRSHVRRSAAPDISPLNLVGDAGQTKIGNHHLPAAIEHNVRRLQIAMQDAFGVRGR